MHNAASLASRVGLKSISLVCLPLRTLEDQLSDSQLKLVWDLYWDGFIQPNVLDLREYLNFLLVQMLNEAKLGYGVENWAVP